MSEQNTNTPDMYKKWEYNNFLDYIKQRKISRAILYAKALGIDRRTLLKWVQQPELNKAITEALDEIVDNMQRAGKDDWRMYKELHAMLTLDDTRNIDVKTNGESINVALVEFIDEKSKDTDTD